MEYLDFADDTQTNLRKRNSGRTGLNLEGFAKINNYLSRVAIDSAKLKIFN